MKIRLIRSATLRMEYAGRRFVIDPYLAARHSRPSFAGRSPNPLVDLPCSPAEVIAGIEWALVSHLHSDHFDPAAQELLSKDTLIFCQPGDETRIAAKGFQHVTPITDQFAWRGMTMTRTPGSRVIATHLDSLDHATISRQALRAQAEANGIRPAQLLIPADGEELVF